MWKKIIISTEKTEREREREKERETEKGDEKGGAIEETEEARRAKTRPAHLVFSLFLLLSASSALLLLAR